MNWLSIINIVKLLQTININIYVYNMYAIKAINYGYKSRQHLYKKHIMI